MAAIIVVCCVVELTLTAADLGLVGNSRWRGLAYAYGGFWSGLLEDWQPNYAAQPYVMFLSYAELHAGIGHLAGNMLALVTLGTIAVERVGQWLFLLLYLGSAIGGGLGFWLLSDSIQPMVGASGALFGLAGAWEYWEWRDRRAEGRALWPLAVTLVALALLNLGLWIAYNGLLAWETHLGGFLAGAGCAALMERWRKSRTSGA